MDDSGDVREGEAPGDLAALAGRVSEFEYALVVAQNGFSSWVVHCAEAAGARGLGALDVLVLHAIALRARDGRLADICLVLNIEDSHVVSYSLKKLTEYGYARHRQDGRDRLYRPTDEGDTLCDRYLELRQASLVASLGGDGADVEALEAAGRELTRMARYYAQASRTAAVLSRR